MGGLGDIAPWDVTLLTLLTFPLPEAFFAPTGEMLIMSIMLNPCSGEKCFWQGKC